MDSTLYCMPVGRLRVLLTVDEDPLFAQRIITLLRVFHRQDMGKGFRGMAQSLYQDDLAGFSDRSDDGSD